MTGRRVGEAGVREEIVALGARLAALGLAPGRSGNLSVRLDDAVLLTPTGTRLGGLVADGLSVMSVGGEHVDGPLPTKEAALHLGIYRARPTATAVVHLHSPHAVAVACLAGLDPANAIPPLTAYQLMQIGRLPLVPFFPPGSVELAGAVEAAAADHHAMLLANHGLLAADRGLDGAAAVAEEIEATARVFLLLRGAAISPVPAEWIGTLERRSRDAETAPP